MQRERKRVDGRTAGGPSAVVDRDSRSFTVNGGRVCAAAGAADCWAPLPGPTHGLTSKFPSSMISQPQPRSIGSRVLASTAMLLLAGSVFGQTSANSDHTVVLSPFEVNAQQDHGFVAATSLAGGRLATDLKDTPVAYSVITRDFIDALGITDLTEAADWSTGQMKFADGAGGGDTYNITAPINIRGVGNVYQLRQRNFFVYFSPMDSFDIERYDFGRGPNQVLFGNGTVGGQTTSMTKRARFDRPFETLETSFGSWHNLREVLDVNVPVNDRYAVRAAAVWADQGGWRRNQMQKTEAAFLTNTFKLTPATELRVEGELGQQSRRIPYAQLNDRLGGWDGATVFAGPMTDAIRSGKATTANGRLLTNTGQPQGVDRRGANYFVYNPFGAAGVIMNYQNDPMTRGAGDSALTPVAGFLQVGSTGFGTAGGPILHSSDLPAGAFETAIEHSAFRLPGESFDNAPDAPTITQNFRDLQLTLSQRVGESLFIELAGDVNQDHNVINNIEGGLVSTYIDINQLLPNGAPNPNYLQPYGDGQYRLVYKPTDAASARLAVAYVHDFGKWGNYGWNVMAGATHQKADTYNKWLMTGAYGDNRLNGDGSVVGIRVRQYWNHPNPYAPPTAPVTYIDPIAGTSQTVTPYWAYDDTTFNNENQQRLDYNYALLAMNAKFFNGRWVILAAERFEDSKQTLKYTKNWGDYPTDYNGQYVLWRPDAPADWSSLTYVPKNASGVATGPAVPAAARPRAKNAFGVPVAEAQYANDRFQDDYNPPPTKATGANPSVGTVVHATRWLSLSYNYAKAISFNTSAAPDPNNHLLPVVQGSGWDAGLRIAPFDGRLNIAFTTYSNREFGNYIDPTSVTNNINTLYNSSPLGVTTSGQGNTRGASQISSVVRDTRTRITDGYELEVTANMTRNWRLLANVALPKVWQKSYAPITRAYVASHADLFKQILADAGGTVGADGVAIVDPTKTPGVDTQRAVNAYNAIYNNIKNFLPDMQLAQDQTITNVFTDYTFSSGRLAGLRVGGGVQIRGRSVIGYRGADSIVDPTNPTRAIDNPNVDAHTTVWAPAYYTVTATLGYRWRLARGRQIDFNLRISNLLNNRQVIYTGGTYLRPANGDYTSPARTSYAGPYAYMDPISYYLTTTLRF